MAAGNLKQVPGLIYVHGAERKCGRSRGPARRVGGETSPTRLETIFYLRLTAKEIRGVRENIHKTRLGAWTARWPDLSAALVGNGGPMGADHSSSSVKSIHRSS